MGAGEPAPTVAEAEGVPVTDAELVGPVGVVAVLVLVLVVGLAWAVARGEPIDGDAAGVGPGEAVAGVVVGVTPTVAAVGGLTSR